MIANPSPPSWLRALLVIGAVWLAVSVVRGVTVALTLAVHGAASN